MTTENSIPAREIESIQPSPNDYLNYIKKKKDQDQQQPVTRSDFIFADEKMLRIKEIVEQTAAVNVPVLITGESGTGKEVIAKMIHKSSARRSNNFVAVNCAALPATLLESELFGFEKGSFTGASNQHKGKFEQASGGTILLDEITETDLNLQAKLLRALQEKEIERIGGNGPVPIDTRVIATSNRDISNAVKEGSFREDLFYRLYVIHLEIPPLRQRPKDIEILTRHFVRLYSQQFKHRTMTISADAMNQLKQYSWPGNVRELKNVIQRSVLMSNMDILTADAVNVQPKEKKEETNWIKHLPIGKKMREVETHFILETLRSHNGNRTHSAKTLGISLRTLRNKINEFTVEGFEVPQPTTGKAI